MFANFFSSIWNIFCSGFHANVNKNNNKAPFRTFVLSSRSKISNSTHSNTYLLSLRVEFLWKEFVLSFFFKKLNERKTHNFITLIQVGSRNIDYVSFLKEFTNSKGFFYAELFLFIFIFSKAFQREWLLFHDFPLIWKLFKCWRYGEILSG